MLEQGRISVRQLAVLFMLALLGDMILIFPSAVSGISQQDAWISCFLALPFGIGVIGLLYYLSSLFPELNLIEINKQVAGTWLGGLLSLWYLFFFLVGASMYVREMGDFITTEILSKTPVSMVILLLVLTLVIGLLYGLESIARTGEAFFLIFMLFLIAMVVLLFPHLRLDHLKPVLGKGILPVLQGSVFTIAYPFGELCVFLMIFPYVKKGPKTAREILIASAIGGFALSIVVTVCLMVLGTFFTKNYIYASYVLAQKISIGHFIERIEIILALNWILGTFFKTIIYYYAFVMGTAQLFNLRGWRPLIIPSAFIIYGMAYLVAPNIAYYITYIPQFWVDWDLTNAIAIPITLIVIHHIKVKLYGRPSSKAPK